jgi:TonB family protein
MSRNIFFWRNAGVIALVHVFVLVGLARWSGSAKPPLRTEIAWMDASAMSAAASVPPQVSQVSLASEDGSQEDPPATEPTVPPMEDPLTMRTPPPGDEGEEPTPTPKPTATPAPKPTPKPSPKPTPQPTSKKAAVKSSPKPKTIAKKEPGPTKAWQTPVAREAANASETAVHNAADSSGNRASSGGGSAAEANWYGNMLHDRFFGEWIQPKSALATGSKMSTLVQLRIEKDGRVSDFSIVRSSGNVVVDESVTAAAKRVTQVDPPPLNLAASGHYDVRINFELSVE